MSTIHASVVCSLNQHFGSPHCVLFAFGLKTDSNCWSFAQLNLSRIHKTVTQKCQMLELGHEKRGVLPLFRVTHYYINVTRFLHNGRKTKLQICIIFIIFFLSTKDLDLCILWNVILAKLAAIFFIHFIHENKTLKTFFSFQNSGVHIHSSYYS